MKTKISLLSLLLLTIATYGQELTLTFENARNTSDGDTQFYEADIYMASSEDFILGGANILFNYNELAFGANIGGILGSGSFEFLQPEGCISGGRRFIPGIIDDPFYSVTVNDNTSSRVSTFFSSNFGAGAFQNFPQFSITSSTPNHLFSIKIKYEDVNEAPNLAFETVKPFNDLFTTVCGPSVGSVANCTSEPGVQLINTTYDSTGAELSSLSVTGISDALTGIRVYPNPIREKFVIRGITEDIDGAKIFNINGVLVKEIKPELYDEFIPVEDFAPGIYFLQLASSGGLKKTIKLLKQ